MELYEGSVTEDAGWRPFFVLEWLDVAVAVSSSLSTHQGVYNLLGVGVKQGCPLSPVLFSIVIESLVIVARISSSIQGIVISPLEYKIVLYADDALLFVVYKILRNPWMHYRQC